MAAVRRIRIAPALTLLAVLAGNEAPGADANLEPKIPPGYRPTLSNDEQGLWMEMAEFEKELARSPLTVRNPEVNQYVRGVVCELAGPYCDDIRIYIVRNPGFNASMSANGMMQIWSGLLTRVRNRDELSVILGHEIAHYTQAHTLDRFRRVKSQLTVGSIASLTLGALTGVFLPVGETMALVSVMAYSRGQEADADFVGARLVKEAGFDPHASYRVWEMLIEEEKRAEAKGDEPAFILRTHPEAETRSRDLKKWVIAEYGPEQPAHPDAGYTEALTTVYPVLMEDQVDTNRFGRTEVLLERHAGMGIDPGLVEFFRGEMFRQRDAEGDQAKAKAAYLLSVSATDPPPEALRNLGYIYLKEKDTAAARQQFHRYLEATPQASDREMIQFYLTDDPQ